MRSASTVGRPTPRTSPPPSSASSDCSGGDCERNWVPTLVDRLVKDG
ncbi:hypothetical protein [Streptomyces sp. NPDC021608]